MRRRAGLGSFGRTGGGTVGRFDARPCPRVLVVAGFTLLAHAGLVALAWQSAPAHEPKPLSRMTVRLVAASPQPAAAAPAPPAIVPKRPATRAVAVRKPAVVAEPSPPPATEPTVVSVPVEEAIRGVAFGPPRIGFAGVPRKRWVAPPQEPVAMAVPRPDVARLAQAHAAREAGRSQIVDALHRQSSQWQLPSDAHDGACALHAEPEAHLACDSDTLMAALAPQEAVLAALLKTYRGMDPGASGLAIAYAEGRYRLAILR